MHLPSLRPHVLLTATSLLPVLHALPSATPNAPFCNIRTNIAIESTQALQGEAFIGTPAKADAMRPKVQYEPKTFSTHLDGGNSRTQDYAGPLGHNLNISTVALQDGQFFWDDRGIMYATYGGPCNGSTNLTYALLVVNHWNFGVEGSWTLPSEYSNDILNTAYTQLYTETSEIIVGTANGRIFILQKCEDANGIITLETRRVIDLSSTGVLKSQTLLLSQKDSDGNIWFLTGLLPGVPNASTSKSSANNTIAGYITNFNKIYTLEITNQTVENGMAVSNNTVFFVTTPTGSNDHCNATGTIQALRAGSNSVKVLWNSSYSAGSSRKLGALSRGAGTTPGLQGAEFVVFGDNADEQINLNVFAQKARGADIRPTCSVPLFKPNASWTDNSPIKYFDGENYHVVIQNLYNDTKFLTADQDINVLNNSFVGMLGGLSKITITPSGNCSLAWTNDEDISRMTTAPTLSTKTGLIYGYSQDGQLAANGEYVWYVCYSHRFRDWEEGLES
ncbi:hypothetical protein AC579_5344 [Pseudocercospora musae]|uniref:Uncharacterized protein n=1 Tax=Pseudocercospora musae TaxID=113226 RepID=A0A139ISN8_9PEZI|nr:hypothetical protein AC579_5344 [Pseudocercospora musae]KXT17807.1 hypothetical protein AC579_5344 [Pseudocercospora musae]KXT17808.1 hypothetical protein AC579_5344 [Pseudocercospora musae]